MSSTLIVLAAGKASRYGRLKQLDPVGPAGEALLDFTIYDAGVSGLERVVVVVREETAGAFMSHFEDHPPAIPVTLALQNRDGRADLPDGGWKPWGTGHAVLAAGAHVDGPFGVANGDDLYGGRAIEALGGWLGRAGAGVEGDAALIGFRVDRTLSPHGGVTRADCRVKDGWLSGLAELTDVRRTEDGSIIGIDHGEEKRLAAASPVSMNLWGFRAEVMERLRVAFETFRLGHAGDPKAEFLLPDFVAAGVRAGAMRTRVIESSSDWIGLTFAADRDAVVERLRELVDAGVYPRAPDRNRD